MPGINTSNHSLKSYIDKGTGEIPGIALPDGENPLHAYLGEVLFTVLT